MVDAVIVDSQDTEDSNAGTKRFARNMITVGATLANELSNLLKAGAILLIISCIYAI